MELSVAHIHGDHFTCAVLQQAIGEAAGRCADIEAAPAGHVERESGQRALEFMAAAAHVTVPAADLDYGGRGTRLACLIPPLTIHPHLPSQDQPLGLFARFRQAARDYFQIETAGLHDAGDYPVIGKNIRSNNGAVPFFPRSQVVLGNVSRILKTRGVPKYNSQPSHRAKSEGKIRGKRCSYR